MLKLSRSGEVWTELFTLLLSLMPKDLKNRFARTSRKGFQLALDVSAYSLIAVAGRAEALMRTNGERSLP